MKLRAKASAKENLLLLLLGIEEWGIEEWAIESLDVSEGNLKEGDKRTKESYGLLLGRDELSEDMALQLAVSLPDTDNPLHETKRLAAMLGRAIGQGEIHI